VLWVFRVKSSDDLSFDARKMHGMLSVVKEGFPDDWHLFRDDFLPDDDRVCANFLLCMIIHSQIEKVEQIVEINFPIRLGICREREILPRLLMRNASCYARLVYCARLFL
jgi:hypothetical protein